MCFGKTRKYIYTKSTKRIIQENTLRLFVAFYYFQFRSNRKPNCGRSVISDDLLNIVGALLEHFQNTFGAWFVYNLKTFGTLVARLAQYHCVLVSCRPSPPLVTHHGLASCSQHFFAFDTHGPLGDFSVVARDRCGL